MPVLKLIKDPMNADRYQWRVLESGVWSDYHDSFESESEAKAYDLQQVCTFRVTFVASLIGALGHGSDYRRVITGQSFDQAVLSCIYNELEHVHGLKFDQSPVPEALQTPEDTYTRLSEEVKTDIQAFMAQIKVETPRDINGEACEACQLGDCCEFNCESMQLTMACNDEGTEWNYQTGDNSFTGNAYGLPHWAVVYLSHDSDREEVARDAIKELETLLPENR